MSSDTPEWTLASFLTEAPPGTRARITDCWRVWGGHEYEVKVPVLNLHCSNEACGRLMLHSPYSKIISPPSEDVGTFFLEYNCNHCGSNWHHFAMMFILNGKSDFLVSIKVGQWPGFGPPLKDNLLALVGSDRELFLQGRRCENQGLGVGAFAYYRRVVENQRSRILSEIIRIARKIELDPSDIASLESARNETQFSRSIELARDAFPQSLLLDGGHNPLTLLHTALSEGLHAQDDATCLEYATASRAVLSDLADRIDRILADKKELDEAVSKLLAAASQRGKPKN